MWRRLPTRVQKPVVRRVSHCTRVLLQAAFDVEVIAPAALTVLSNTLPRGVHEVSRWARQLDS